MALSPLAFGPLSPAAQHAAMQLGAPSMPGGLNLSRLTAGRSFGEPAQAAQVSPVGLATGTQAPIEEQTPLLPQGEATGERGDVTQLPGFQAATAPGGPAELPSGDELSPGEQQQVTQLRNALQRLANQGGGDQAMIDAAKALQGANKAITGATKGYQLGRLTAQAPPAAPFTSGAAKPTLPTNPLEWLSAPGTTFTTDIPAATRVPYVAPENLSGAAKPGLAPDMTGPSTTGAGLSGPGLAGAGAGLVAAMLPLLASYAGLRDPYAQAALQLAAPVAAPAAAGAAGGAAAGTGAAAGAGTALASALPGLIAAAPIAAGTVMAGLLSYFDSASAAEAMKRRLRNINSQLPGEINNLLQAPGIANELTATSSPEEAANVLKRLNELQRGFQEGGWESYWKGGATTVGGGSAGKDITVALPGVQTALNAVMQQIGGPMTLSRLRAEDILGKAGWGPEQIAQEAGRYISPTEWAMNIAGPSFQAALRPEAGLTTQTAHAFADLQDRISRGEVDPNAPAPLTPEGLAAIGLNPEGRYTYQDLANFFGRAGAGTAAELLTETPYGNVSSQLLTRLTGIQPGNIEQGLAAVLQPYGGFAANLAPYGIGQGFPAATVTPGAAAPETATPATSGDVAQALQRLVAQTGGPAGALGPTVPSEFVTALRNPAALQSLLAQPGMLARLFPGVTGGQ